MTHPAEKLALGLDLGGSSIKIALLSFNSDGIPSILAQESRKIHPSRTLALVLDDLSSITKDFRGRYGSFDSIGVGLPGIHNEITGQTSHMRNFSPEWEGSFFRKEITARLGQFVALANDARAFSLAESVLGAGAGFDVVVCVVMGTGIGGGVVINGKVWKEKGTVGEIGHMSVDFNGPLCGCGNQGCVETFAGAAPIIAAGGRPTVAGVFEAALAGDELAKQAVDRAISALAAGLANTYVLLAPDVIVVGGGVANAGSQLFDPLIAQIRKRARIVSPEKIHVLPAKLGLYAGAIGAALMGANA